MTAAPYSLRWWWLAALLLPLYAFTVPLRLPGSPVLAALPFWGLAVAWAMLVGRGVGWGVAIALLLRGQVATSLDLEPSHFYRPAMAGLILTYAIVTIATWKMARRGARPGALAMGTVATVALAVGVMAWLLGPQQQSAVLWLLVPWLLTLAAAGAGMAVTTCPPWGPLAALAVVVGECLAAWQGLRIGTPGAAYVAAAWLLVVGGWLGFVGAAGTARRLAATEGERRQSG